MNGSLVAFYGATPKPPALQDLIGKIGERLTRELGSAFIPYTPGQVHATIVGLEAVRAGEYLVSSNWAAQRGTIRLLDLKGVIDVVRSSQHLPVSVRLGGFDLAHQYSFTSRGLHPVHRSFSVQGRIVVAMGWPVVDDRFSPSIDLLRRDLARVGALHKYHGSESEVDNDFFLVLGQVERRGLRRTVVANVEQMLRTFLSSERAEIVLGSEDLSFVVYEEATLAPERTRQFSLDEIAADPTQMTMMYAVAV